MVIVVVMIVDLVLLHLHEWDLYLKLDRWNIFISTRGIFI